jgi:hypothetical protein
MKLGLFPKTSLLLTLLFSFSLALAQPTSKPIARLIEQQAAALSSAQPSVLLERLPLLDTRATGLEAEVSEATFFSFPSDRIRNLLQAAPAVLIVDFSPDAQHPIVLELTKAEVFAEDFSLYLSSDRQQPYPYEPGLHYWGIANGDPNSMAAISITKDEVMGLIQLDGVTYTLGKINNRTDRLHILYQDQDLNLDFPYSCDTDDEEHYIGQKAGDTRSNGNPDNCVKMYVEVDYDIVVGKGGVTQAADYVSGAFSQVAILYANESINFTISEMLVWSVQDPYTGPSTSNYLTQFRDALGGNYNGDLAHLVGYQGGGGVAYLDVLCNKFYGVGYSAINTSYANVPTYSWTVMVLAHEIGHNLGSRHTHACVWNGNNTAIDGCGPAAGYSEGCDGPIPSSGTIMSYCHLISGVGINFNNGFGPQPGDLMRSRVYNASCLSPCGPPIVDDAGIAAIEAPVGYVCEATIDPIVQLNNYGSNSLTSVTIHYRIDNGPVSNYSWTGSLAANSSVGVTLPAIAYAAGEYAFTAYTSNPNGVADTRPDNDQSSSSFIYIPDYCVCFEATGAFPINPLTHSGGGSSSTTLAFEPGSKNPSFTISDLASKLNGNPNTRYADEVTVSYIDSDGVGHTYGVFSGESTSTASVSIQGFVNSITISLRNGLNTNYNGTLSVSLSAVDYCSPSESEPCPDADGDGVCDEDDICPDFDDNLIGTPCDDGDPCTINDVYTADCLCAGTYDPACDEEDCTDEITSNFSPNPLNHLGTGSSTSTVAFPGGNSNVSFTINGLDARLNGNPSRRYDEQVTVSYINGQGQNIVQGVYLGSVQSSVAINIPGEVQSVSVALADAYDGDASPDVLSVSMTAVTSCLSSPGIPQESVGSQMGQSDFKVYPNPARRSFFVSFEQAPENAEVVVSNLLGMELARYRVAGQPLLNIQLEEAQTRSQLLFVTMRMPGQAPVVKTVVLLD